MSEPSQPAALLCPSAQPEWPGSVVIGVVGGTVDEPRVAHLEQPVPTDGALLQLTIPVTPTEVFRFAAPCVGHGCVHFAHNRCQLAQRVVVLLEEVTKDLPKCQIRPACRWWQQEGRAACKRCPQVITDNYNPSAHLVTVAGPQQ